jgi:prevent-host-death family protein
MDARTTEFALATAKAKLSELVERASHGEEITISRHGKVIAKLVGVSAEAEALRRRQQAHDDWIAYRSKHNITLGPDLTIRQLIDEGRKY